MADSPWRLTAAGWVARGRSAVKRLSGRARHRRGGPERPWKARLDTPAEGEVLTRGLNVVGGWGIHEWRRMQGVVVTVNGRPHTFVTEFHEREDVARRWSDFATVDTAGWSAVLDLGDFEGEEVVVSAHALLEPKRRGVRPGRRLGPVRHIGTARGRVDSTAKPSGLPTGHFHQQPFVLSGFASLSGVIFSEEEIATVEISINGRSVGRARTMPSLAASSPEGETVLTTSFSSVVEVPSGMASVSLSATYVSMSGEAHEVTPWRADVRAPTHGPTPGGERLALVRDRTAEQLAALARGTAAQEPRVLVATADLGLGGGQLYLHDLMTRLVRRGVRFALTSPRSGTLTAELEAMGVPVLVTGPPPVQDPEAYETQVRDIAAFAVQHGCTAVLANIVTSFTGADAGLRLGLPLTWAIHESYPFEQMWIEAYGPQGAHPYVVERARLSLAAASRVVFEATQTLRFYEELLSAGAGVVVPYGVDVEDIARFRDGVDRDELRAELGIGPDTRALLCMGTVEPRKGQLNLAHAFAHAAALKRADVQLIFVGAVPGQHYADALIAYAEGLGDERIRVEPVQRDVHRWYHACDVLVSASDVESLPRSMLEAMAFGRPVASAAVFGIPELVEDGRSGFLCRPRDVGALRRMLERVAETSRDDLLALGDCARDVVTTRHDPSVYERYFLEALHSAPVG